MSLLDDILGSVREVTDNVVERTGKLVDVSKLKLTSAEISKEITRRYEALGRLIYDSSKEGTDIAGLTEECVKSIDALYNRLDDVNSRIAKLKDKRYCASCGAVLDRSALYCARCGSRVMTGTEAADAEKAEKAKKAAEVVEKAAEKAEEAAKEAAATAEEAIEEAIEKAAEIVEEAAEAVSENE